MPLCLPRDCRCDYAIAGSGILCGLSVRSGNDIDALAPIFLRSPASVAVDVADSSLDNIGVPVPTGLSTIYLDNSFNSTAELTNEVTQTSSAV